VFFRADSLSAALTMLGTLRSFHWSPDYPAAWLFLAILGTLGFLIDLKIESDGSEYLFQNDSSVLRLGTAVALLAFMVLFSAGGANAFIYFQF
jgi:hypothetical protein